MLPLTYLNTKMENRMIGLIMNAMGKVYIDHVVDGDSFKSNRDEYRLFGLDAPEFNQAFGADAHMYLQEYIEGKYIDVEEVGIDRYGRKLVIARRGHLNINQEMIANGMAFCNHRSFYRDEQRAKELVLGVHRHPKMVKPYVHRLKTKYIPSHV
jgi:endonuclease YncB( thermonuclease family)